MNKDEDNNANFLEFDFPKFEQFEVDSLMLNLDGLLDFSFGDFVS